MTTMTLEAVRKELEKASMAIAIDLKNVLKNELLTQKARMLRIYENRSLIYL